MKTIVTLFRAVRTCKLFKMSEQLSFPLCSRVCSEVLEKSFKLLTTLGFLSHRFVITPPHRDFAEVITKRWSVCLCC